MKLAVLNASRDTSPEEVIARLKESGVAAMTERTIPCTLDGLTRTERDTLKAGCLINYYKTVRC